MKRLALQKTPITITIILFNPINSLPVGRNLLKLNTK